MTKVTSSVILDV